MLYVVRFHDVAGREDRRQENMAAHLAFLDTHAPALQAAGPLSTEDGAGSGGLWVIEAEDAAQLDTIIRADPLYAAGLRDRWEVYRWRQVHRDGTRQI